MRSDKVERNSFRLKLLQNGIYSVLLLFLSLTAILTGGCAREQPASPPVTVFFTCDISGRLEPCGCFSGQHGGLTRLATYLGGAASPDAIVLDAGNAIAGHADYQVIQYRSILEAFGAMGFAAANIGHREAGLSAAVLRELANASPVPLLSANLLDASTGQPLLQPYHIVERGSHRIAVIGVLDPRHLEDRLGEGLAVTSMRNTLANLIPQLSGVADHLILLAFTGVDEMRTLAREFYELDLILGGDVPQPSQELIFENNSAILFTTNQGRTVGAAATAISADGALAVEKFDMVLVEEIIPEDPAILQLSRKYRDEIRHTVLDIDRSGTGGDESAIPGIASPIAFIGTPACASCHQEDHGIWKETGHARAFQSLHYRESQADPNCIPCHTVGFGSPSGYRRAYAGEKLADVGCESCHGPGSEHVRQRAAGGEATFKFRPLGAADCTSCHYGEFSRPFDWDEFWPHVKHGRKLLSRH